MNIMGLQEDMVTSKDKYHCLFKTRQELEKTCSILKQISLISRRGQNIFFGDVKSVN